MAGARPACSRSRSEHTLRVALAICQVLVGVLDQVQQSVQGSLAVQVVQQGLMHPLLCCLDVLAQLCLLPIVLLHQRYLSQSSSICHYMMTIVCDSDSLLLLFVKMHPTWNQVLPRLSHCVVPLANSALQIWVHLVAGTRRTGQPQCNHHKYVQFAWCRMSPIAVQS